MLQPALEVSIAFNLLLNIFLVIDWKRSKLSGATKRLFSLDQKNQFNDQN